MYSGVVHHYWDRPGGGQLVCGSVAKAFEVLGYKPVLASVPRFELRDKYVEWFGIDLNNYDVVNFIGIKLKSFGIYLRLFVGYLIKKVVKRYSPSIIFTDECTYRNVERIVRERSIMFIEYIHFPMEISIDSRYRGSGLYYGEDPYILERYSKFPMNIYWWGYSKMLSMFLRRNPFEIASLVLTNSRWTADLCRQIYGDIPKVLNPPIAPNVEVLKKPREFDERDNIVVMLGRFSEEKRYHWVIEEILSILKKEVNDVKLYIFGGAKTRTSISYLKRIEELARRRGFRASRRINDSADLYLVPDASRSTINNVMDRAKVFLHATINEHWGIAVAEAMARGLPVVVHRSGGTWSDLVAEGVYGYGYTDAQEAIETVSRILTDKSIWSSFSAKSIAKAKNLTLDKFIEQFRYLVKPLT
ncbi:MAG: glycosyltransferase [Ignisphaera sp.]|uniref:Glycosyltransferase n=1 Tax=Ignisphaera aggregans TaxID=334771 RepID=A0A7J3MZZ8_9CREN